MTRILETLGFYFWRLSPSMFSHMGMVQQDPEEVQEFPLKGEECCLEQIWSEHPYC